MDSPGGGGGDTKLAKWSSDDTDRLREGWTVPCEGGLALKVRSGGSAGEERKSEKSSSSLWGTSIAPLEDVGMEVAPRDGIILSDGKEVELGCIDFEDFA